MVTFDAIIIGTGQAGPALAARLAGAGMKVAVVERAKFGGTCVNDGCTPTKTLVASAYAAHMARRAADYGVDIAGSPRMDMKRVKARKDAVVARSSRGVEDWMRGLANAKVYAGHARFTGRRTVRVNGETLEAERIFIDVGGRPRVPPLRGIDEVPYLTNQSIMDVDFVPAHLLVVGGSYIGLELAQVPALRLARDSGRDGSAPRRTRRRGCVTGASARFSRAKGSKSASPPSVSASARRRRRRARARLQRGRTDGAWLASAARRRPRPEHRRPGARGRAGIETDERGYIAVDEALRTTNPRCLGAGRLQRQGRLHPHRLQRLRDRRRQPADGAGRKWTDRIPRLRALHRPAARAASA
jgi:hypothetical protein